MLVGVNPNRTAKEFAVALLNILKYPDPRLRTVARAVAVVDDEVREFAQSMLQTMYAAEGVGLAATQVNVHRRIIVVDVSEKGDSALVLINPTIVERSDLGPMREGCLSVPGYFDDLVRAQRIKVRALALNGEEFEEVAEARWAVCIQHEMEHLDGILFVDHLSELKRSRVRAKLEKERRRAR
jgi:peptide deformylase